MHWLAQKPKRFFSARKLDPMQGNVRLWDEDSSKACLSRGHQARPQPAPGATTSMSCEICSCPMSLMRQSEAHPSKAQCESQMAQRCSGAWNHHHVLHP
jgi:hypothetical protein